MFPAANSQHNAPAEENDYDHHQLDHMLRDDHDQFDSRSGGIDVLENPSGEDDDQDDPNQHSNKKPRRHTQHQIQELELFFKHCSHPDDKQRKELGERLGLEPLQIKFWFQNRRTLSKFRNDRQENTQLSYENEKLRADNIRCRQALANATCPNSCGSGCLAAIGDMAFDKQQLRMENAHLLQEINKLSAIYAKYVGNRPLLSYQIPPALGPSRSVFDLGQSSGSSNIPNIIGGGDIVKSVSGHNVAEKPMMIELAVAAMEEFIRVAQVGEPLWIIPSTDNIECLNENEYLRNFPTEIGLKPIGLRSEASRESAIILMEHTKLLEIMMDPDQWSNFFSGIVSRAMTIDVLSTGGAGNYNGALQVMTSEFWVPSPFVPTRENYYLRYCKQHENGLWAIADVSLENLRPASIPRYRRRPSGCLIQQLPDGYSKVTWVEHVQVDNTGVHDIYKPLVNSGLAFGAKRWAKTLERQGERALSDLTNNIFDGDVGVTPTTDGRESMLKLAERMVSSFWTGVGTSSEQKWTTLSGSGAGDIRIMIRKNVDEAPCVMLSAATSIWLPVPPKMVFDFLRAENSRSQWDILSDRGLVQEMAHFATGADHGDSVSLLLVNSTNSSHNNMLILQESCLNPSGSYVIYAPVDITAMNAVLSGGVPYNVPLLPSGFAILPDGPPRQSAAAGEIVEVGSGGTLLTVSFQILADSVPTAQISPQSVATMNNLIKCTVQKIQSAVTSHHQDV